MKPIKTLPSNPAFHGMAVLTGDIQNGPDSPKQSLRLLTPWNRERTYPLVVFIQGSGWTFPNIGKNLPHLGDIAREGYVVATVTHRSSSDGDPFPAFLQDVKSAIRYLRAHAAEYCIDPTRVLAYGTSSGGNTALLLALTGDDPRYKTGVHPEQSDAVQAVAECFGPTHMMALFTSYHGDMSTAVIDPESEAYYNGILGHPWRSEAGQQAANDMSPLCILREGMALPPMLLLYGDDDHVVPYEQGERMYEKLCALGYEAEMVRVSGAHHEGNFWSGEVRAEIIAYIKAHL